MGGRVASGAVVVPSDHISPGKDEYGVPVNKGVGEIKGVDVLTAVSVFLGFVVAVRAGVAVIGSPQRSPAATPEQLVTKLNIKRMEIALGIDFIF